MGTNVPRSFARLLLVGALVAIGMPVLAASGGAVAAPGTPGVAQAAPVLFSENFENRPNNTTTTLASYVSASGQAYTADPYWIDAGECNGFVLNQTSPVRSTDCIKFNGGVAPSWALPFYNAGIRDMAAALGVVNGTPNPATNSALSELANSTNPLNQVEFRTATPVTLAAVGRYFVFSVNAVATTCVAGLGAPVLAFYAEIGGVETPLSSTPINVCTDPRSSVIAASSGLGTGPILGGSFASSDSLLYTGASLNVILRNQGTSPGGGGNDHALDDIKVLDATPQLDKSFSPATTITGQASTLTITITNTSELAAKNGWSFTDALPANLVVASGATTTCPSGVITAAVGSGAISGTGNLASGMTSCTFTIPVTSTTAGTYTNGPTNMTEVGLNPPGPGAAVTFNNPAPSLSLVKSASPSDAASFVVGQNITYSFVVTNDGNVPVSGIAITETAFSGSGTLSTPVCPGGAVAPGDSVICTASYTVTSADVLTAGVTNSATASGTPSSGTVPVSPVASFTVPAAQAPALTIVKSVSPTTATAVNDSVAYRFAVTNLGNVNLSGATIDETAFSGSGAAPVASCPPGTIVPGQTVICTATYVLTQADVDLGSVGNTATGSALPANGPAVTSPPSSALVTIAANPALTLVKSADHTTISGVGQTINYAFTVTNTGNVTASNVEIIEGTFTGAGALSVVTCPLGALSLAPAAQVVCTASYITLASDVGGDIQNSAFAQADPPSGQAMASNSSIASVIVTAAMTTTGLLAATGVMAPVAAVATLSMGVLAGGIALILSARRRRTER
jgi:uncharacterized repeat protein (TIGR01451 family)